MNEIFEEGQDFPAQSFDSDDESIIKDAATQAAEKAFGIKYLFPWQKLVIANILDAADPRDLTDQDDEVCRGRQIVLLPTGAGKSLCFLTPALLLPGPTLVMYPLLALMADQQRRMEEGSLSCVVFKGGQTQAEREANFEKLKNGARVILANPEVLQDEKLVQRLKKCSISHIAIDEAHCVSEWGDSFRPAYLTLGKIIKELDVKIVTAFTATASPPVLNRVKEILFDGEAHLIQSSSDRANIHYSVKYAEAKEKAVLKECIINRKPLIVFCSSRKRTEMMARLLAEYFGNDRAKFYHAGMTKEEKLAVEKWFFDSQDGLLCVTCAYGMGMDKGNIYTVIHLDVPEHMENFIQEAGRAGRKGDEVKSILFWSHKDEVKFKKYKASSREAIMAGFAQTKGCRRDYMLSRLSGEQVSCSGCDFCDARSSGKTLDFTRKDSETALNLIKKNRKQFVMAQASQRLIKILNEQDFPLAKINIWEDKDAEEILNGLISEGRIKKTGDAFEHRLDIRKIKKRIFSLTLLHRLHQLRRHYHCLRQILQKRLTTGFF